MKTKKILAAIAALTIVCSAVPTQPFADVIGNMAITASAETKESDFEFEDGVISRYYGYDTEVVIPSTIGGVTVTSIDNGAFIDCENLTSITIPDSVKKLGDGYGDVFYGCSNLKNITAPCRLKGNASIANAISNGATVTYNHVFAEDSDTCECDEKVERYIKGSCGVADYETLEYANNATYVFDKATGTLTISGEGEIGEGAFDAECIEFAASIRKVIIEDGITDIVDFAFAACLNIESVSIPESVEYIGNGAFYKCESLKEITVDENNQYLISVDDVLFSKDNKTLFQYAGKKGNESYTIPDSVTEISNYAFTCLENLKSISAPCALKGNAGLPDNIIISYNHVFADNSDSCSCKTISKGTCGESAFYEFNNETGKLTISGEGAVKESGFDHDDFKWVEKIQNVEIKSGITEIGKYAFYGCANIQGISIPETVSVIGDYAFSQCTSLEDMTIPESVSSIGIYAFYNTKWLDEKRENNPLVIINGILADGFACTGEVIIPDTVKTVLPYCFAECTGITNVTLPDTISSIENAVFYKCNNLESISMPNTVTKIGDSAFSQCTSLGEEIVIPESVKSIGDSAFRDCSSLENIIIPASVEYIGGSAFSNTPWLESQHMENQPVIFNGVLLDGSYCKGDVIIPDTAKIISDRAFYRCNGIESITLPDTVTKIGTFAFSECADLRIITLSDSVEEIGAYAFANNKSIEEIIIPDSVATIGKCIFEGSENITSIKVPCRFKQSVHLWKGECDTDVTYYHVFAEDSDACECDEKVERYITGSCGNNATYVFDKATGTLTISGKGAIGRSAFDDNFNTWVEEIEKVVIGDGITEIGDFAFQNCTSLATVEMNSVTLIGVCAFYGCSSLKSVEMNSVTSIESNAFQDCTSLATVEMNSVKSIEVGAFQDCTSLATVEMNSVTSIEEYAFFGCESLTSVTLGSTVPDGLLDCYIPDTAKLIIPAEAYENYKDLGYNLGFSDIKGIGYILEGQIGIRLATDLSADKLVVMCGDKTIDLTQKDGYVEFFVAAQDMAKEYTVYYVDGKNKIEIAKFNPNNNLSGYKDTEYEAVAEALITYCETANAYFNGGEIADMSSEYDDVINAITPNTVDMGEDYDSSSLILESNTIVRHYYTKNDGTMTAKGNYFYKEESVDPTMFARTDTYSVNDYIYKVLNSDKADANLKNLCVTLYKYGVAAKGYIKHTHTEVIDSPYVAPTCTADGHTESSHCSVCGEVIVAQEVISATGHTKTTDKAIAPTCTTKGLTEGSHCSVCGEVITAQKNISATGHTKTTDKAIAPTCTATGLTEESHCSVCGEVIVAQEVISATGHTKVTDKAIAPTCTTKGLTEGSHCSVCGEVIVAQKNISASHTKVIDTPSVAATCTADGRTEGSHCSVCNAIISTSTTIAPLGHKYSEGYCGRCGEKDTSGEVYSFNYTMTEPLEERPAGQIVKIAKQYKSEITISCNGKTAKCTILAIMELRAKEGDEVTVTAKGPDAGAAIVEVQKFFEENL